MPRNPRKPKRTTEALATVEPADCVAHASAERASCPKCGKTVAGGAIVEDPKENGIFWLKKYRTLAIDRAFYCDHCDHVVEWSEAVHRTTTEPTGVVVAGPFIQSHPRVVAKFLRDHPQAAGVSQC